MRPKSLRHIGTAAAYLDDGGQHVADLAAGATELRRNPQPEHARLPERFDRSVLQDPLPLDDGVIASECTDDLWQPGKPFLDGPAKWGAGERLSWWNSLACGSHVGSRGYRKWGMMRSANRSSSCSSGWNWSMNSSTPASWKAWIRSITCP